MKLLQVKFLLAILTLISVSANKSSLNDFLFNGNFEFIDLTYPYNNETIYWPDVQKFIFTKRYGAYNDRGSWYATNDIGVGEHVGTHIDAPYHFNKEGKHVGGIKLENLIVPLIVADISSKVKDDPNYVLYKSDLDYMLNDNFGKPCLIIFKFGWGKYYHDRKKYLGIDEKQQTLSFPGLSAEVAEWIVKSYKNVVGVGVDVASVDPGSSNEYPVHQILSAEGLYNIENVNFNQDIPEYGCAALVLPMKIELGTGAPLRLVAICPKKV